MTVLDAQALDDIAHGACFLGSGGGGALSEGLALAKTLPEITMLEAGEVDGDAWMAVSAVIGSPTAASRDNFSSVAVKAYEALAEAAKVTFTHVLVGEIGAVNTLIPMLPAAQLKLPLVDASGSPRALPLLANCYFADSVEISPIALANTTDAFTVNAPDAELADPLLRGIISASGLFGDCAGFALWAMDGDTMRAQALPGTVERARKVGELLRTADDKLQALCDFLGAKVLFRGTLTVTQASGGGFDTGTATVTNGSETLTIYEQDENLIAWRDGDATPLAMAPDVIGYLTADGKPFSNADEIPAGEVVIVGVPAARLGFAEEKVIASFAKVLAATGYPGPYLPL